MTSIELTDEQRRVLQAEQGKGEPVDVVDPATQQLMRMTHGPLAIRTRRRAKRMAG
jgi:hypothetical protein